MTRTKLLIVSLFVLFSATTFYGQSMLKEGNQWNLLSTSCCSPEKITVLVKVDGDTLINDVSYSKLFTTRDTFDTNWVLREELMREDTTGKVFLREQNGEEILLLDFGLQVGDIFESLECNLRVAEIDVVILNNGEERKRIHLDNADGWTYTWIEGLGSTIGPTFRSYCIFDAAPNLLCFYEDDEVRFPDSPNFCFVEQTNSVQHLLPADLKIYPNPFNKELHIEFKETLIESYTLVDLLGQEIVKGTLAGGLIDVSNIPAGAITILLQGSDGSVYSEKLIKVD